MSDSPVERENLTAALVRDYDDEQLVEWIHALQDREEELEAEVERLREALLDLRSDLREQLERQGGLFRHFWVCVERALGKEAP